MIPFAAVDVLGLFVEPAVFCLCCGLMVSYGIRLVLDRFGVNRFVWNRALFDFAVLIAVTALLILSLRIPNG